MSLPAGGCSGQNIGRKYLGMVLAKMRIGAQKLRVMQTLADMFP